MRLLDLFEDSGKTVAVAFGRLNPPTIGHEKLVEAVLKQKANDHFLFVSQTEQTTGKNKKRLTNPLPFAVKLPFIQKAFPNIPIGDTSVKTVIEMMKYLENQGYENVIFVCGSDRVPEFTQLLNDQNGVDYNIKNLKIVSSGARDPDSEGAEGMSGTKLRQAVIDNDLEKFKSGLASGLQADAESVFSAVRKGLEPWINESSVSEAPIEFDTAEPMNPMIHSAGGNPAKLQYRMMRAAAQLKDLASRAQGASPSEWQSISKHFEELTMNINQIKHGLEELAKQRRKGGVRSRGIDPHIEGVQEGKFRSKDIEDKVIDNEKLNDLKSKYLPDWEMLDHRILQAKYVAKDHRHAEEFISYINKVSEQMDHFAEVTQDVAEVTVKTSTFDVKGLTVLDFKLALKVDKFAESNDIEQVRMKGNFGMHEGSYGRYWCSTDKKWKTRKGPKQTRKSK